MKKHAAGIALCSVLLLAVASVSIAAAFNTDWRDRWTCVYGEDNAVRRRDGALDVKKQLREHVFWVGGERMHDFAVTAKIKFISAKHKYSGFSVYIRHSGELWAQKSNYWVYLRPKYRGLFMQKYSDGQLEKQFAEGVDAKRPDAVPVGEWLTLRVVAKGRQIRTYLNGKLHLSATDDSAFPLYAGRVGFGVGNAHVVVADIEQTNLEQSHRIEPESYEYGNRPIRGDESGTILTDGKVNPRQKQAFWRMLGKTPIITFDLGAEYFVTRLTLRAVSAPAVNIASAQVKGITDGESFETVATLDNEDTGRAVAEHELVGDVRRTARYIRVTLNRPAADQDVELAEVEFYGRRPTRGDRHTETTAEYDTGPRLPQTTDAAREDDNYWYLSSERARFAIDKQHGIVAGGWGLEHDKKCIERLSDAYHLYSRDGDAEGTEYGDRVTAVADHSKGRLKLRCRNEKLADIAIDKTWELSSDGRRLIKRVEFTNQTDAKDRFVTHQTGAIASQDFRRGAVYMGCDRGLGARLFADNVKIPRKIGALGSRNAKVVILHRYDLGWGIAQFRHKVNGRWCRPLTSRWHEKKNHPPTYLPNGWKFGVATLHLAPREPRSTEVHFAFYNGRQIDFYRLWRNLPEVRAAYEGIERPDWHRDLKTCARISVDRLAEDLTPLMIPIERTLAMVETGNLWHLSHIHGVWGNWFTGGSVLSGEGAKIDTEWLKRFIGRVHEKSPRMKLGVYTWAWAVHPRSRVYQQHPEWFITHDRDGQVFNAYSNLSLNHARRFSIPGSMDHLIGQFAAIMREFDGDYFYLDGGGGGQNLIDWDHLGCDQDYHYEKLYRRIRKITRECGDDRAVWFNARTGPWWDIGYYEGIDRILHASTWRQSADGLSAVKIRQVFDPDQVVIPLYWRDETMPFFSNYCIGLGITPSRPLNAKTQMRRLPWIEAAYETRRLRWTEADLKPDWRVDAETEIEAYALRHGEGAVISVIDHRENEAGEAVVSADTERLGLDAGMPIYAFTFGVRDIRDTWRALPESRRREICRKTDWGLDTVGKPLDVRVIENAGERIKLSVPTERNLLRMVILSNSPAAIFSVDGLRVNFWAPEVSGATVKASTSDGGKRIRLQTSAPDGGAEVIVCAPEGSRFTGADVRPLVVRGRWCGIVDVPAGDATTTLTTAKLSESGGELTVRCPKSVGVTEPLKVQTEPPVENAAVSIRRNGLLLFAGRCSADDGAFDVSVPPHVHPGQLGVGVRGKTAKGRLMAGHSEVKVTGGHLPDLPPWRLPKTGPDREIKRVDANVGGLHVLRSATESYDGRDGTQVAVTEAQKLRFGGGMRDAPRTRYGYGFGALELQDARVLKLRITNSFYDAWTLRRNRVSFHPQYTSTFAGMLVDYHTPQGYSERVALGAGILNPEREDPRPRWGAKAAPVKYIALADAIHKSSEMTLTIDLRKWAPDKWDGRCWITAGAENVYPSRRIFVKILEAADKAGKRDITAGKTVGDIYRIREYSIPRVETAPKVDGKIGDPVWTGIEAATDFLLLGQLRGPEQQTRAWAAWDDSKLYVAIDCPETAKQKLNTAAKKIWNQDAVDVMLDPDGDRSSLQQIIVNCEGRCEQFTQGGNGRKVEWDVEAAAGRYDGGWAVEVAVPWSEMGVSPEADMKMTGNFARYRPYPPVDEMHTFASMPGPQINDPERFAKLMLQ